MHWKNALRATLAGAIFSGKLLPALAQPAAPEVRETELQEVIVTAQKRAQKLQDIGVSVSALDADMLAAIGKTDVIGLAAAVPDLQVNQYSPTITVFNIRGVSQNDFADSQEAPIAFYNDEVYVSALGAIAGQMFDLSRVEVLRGPQGTLFGRNATGGLVQVVSAKPTASPEAFVSVTGGSYGQIATEAALNGPLTDGIRARLSFSSNDHDGYRTNLTGPDLGNAHQYGVRLQVDADVGNGGDLLVKLEGLRNNHEFGAGYSFAVTAPNAQGLGEFLGPTNPYWGTCPGCNLLGYKSPTNNPYVTSTDTKPLFDRSYGNIEIHYTRPIGDTTLTSITDYQLLHKSYIEDTDASPLPFFEYDTRQNLGQVSQELRLAGDHGALNWVGGLYGLFIDTSDNYNVKLDPDISPSFFYHSHTRTGSVAGFGQVEYALADDWKVIGGLRYSEDWKYYDYRIRGTDGSFFSITPETDPQNAKERFGNYSGKFEVDYKPTATALIYASVNRGTKSGGFGTPAATPVVAQTLPFGQEVLSSIEAGEKITILNKTTSIDGSVFYYDYHDYQAFSSQGLSQFVTNHNASVKGAELEIKTVPLTGLHLSAFATILDTNVKNISLPDGEVADRQMPQAPHFSGGGSLRYDHNLWSGVAGIETDWRYDGRSYFSVFNGPVDLEHAHVVGNVRLTYAPDVGGWEAAFFINNVTDKAYRVYDLDVSALSISNQVYAPPRWFGGTLTYRM